jgi:hypothetical protein
LIISSNSDTVVGSKSKRFDELALEYSGVDVMRMLFQIFSTFPAKNVEIRC